ncbi:MAG TPA: DUF4340 domain-containing protein, partial [Polyangiaceae bacterium]|nr:DUF4340 domain-containing protein [Polyangiaceae bacterium]
MRRQLLVNGAIVAFALGTLGVVWLTRQTPTTTELDARKDKLFPSYRKDDVTRVSISDGQQLLELARAADGDQAGDFRIVKPWAERADLATVNELLGSLELASALRPADGVSPDQAGLGQHALRIALETAGEKLRVTLGGPAPAPAGARYAKVENAGVSKLFVVSQGVAKELALPFDKFRETRLLEYGRSELGRLELTRGDDKLEIEQRGRGAFFVQGKGASELCDRATMERILTALSRLSSEVFVEPEAARAALGKDAVRLQLQLLDKAVAPVSLSFGSSCPKAPEQALLLREQAGKSPRAACIPSEVAAALRVSEGELRLAGPFSTRTDEVEELRVTLGAQKLELARKDNGFVLRAPSSGEVPLDAGNQRISAILDARGERPASPLVSSLNLDPPAGDVTIQIAGADEAAHRQERVLVGRARHDGSVCIQRDADRVVLCVDAQTARAFTPDATLLRGLGVLSFAPSELRSLRIQGPDLEELVLRHEDGSYELQEPKGFRHDGALVADAVQTLGALQALRWVSATSDDPAFGLASARLHVSVALASGGTPRELLVGAPTDAGYFARVTPEPGVFVLARSTFRDLAAPLIERALCPLTAAELLKISLKTADHALSLERRDETWSGDGVSPTRAAELGETLSALRADF